MAADTGSVLSRRRLFTKVLAAVGAGAAASLAGTQRVFGGVDDNAAMYVGGQYGDVETTTSLANFRGGATVFQATSTSGTAIKGTSTSQYGVQGTSTSYAGVHGQGAHGVIGQANSQGGYGVRGANTGGGPSIYAQKHAAGRALMAYIVNGQSSDEAVIGITDGTGPGVKGYSLKGTGVVGEASGVGAYGGHFSGGKAQLRLTPRSTGGKPSTGSHQKGEIYMDKNGALFVCTAAGTPGTWRKVTTTAT